MLWNEKNKNKRISERSCVIFLILATRIKYCFAIKLLLTALKKYPFRKNEMNRIDFCGAKKFSQLAAIKAFVANAHYGAECGMGSYDKYRFLLTVERSLYETFSRTQRESIPIQFIPFGPLLHIS